MNDRVTEHALEVYSKSNFKEITFEIKSLSYHRVETIVYEYITCK